MQKEIACRKCGRTFRVTGEGRGGEKMWMVKCPNAQCGEEQEIAWSIYGGFSVESSQDHGERLDVEAIIKAQNEWEAAQKQ